MDDASKPKDEETSETPVEDVKEEVAEEPQPDTKSEEKPEEQPKEETPTKEAPKAEESDKPAESPKEETPAEEKPTEKTPEPVKEQPTDKSEETPAKPETQEEPVKIEEKKEHKKEIQEKKDHPDDFMYIVRIANTDIDGEKTLVRGLTSIKGVGMHISVLIVNETGIDKHAKMGDLKDAQIKKIQNALDNITKSAPRWMLNHRKDPETGEDIHLVGSDIDMRLRDEINIMKKIRSYQGIRHERGLTVRGQRTRANNRKGLALGVSKKREPSSK